MKSLWELSAQAKQQYIFPQFYTQLVDKATLSFTRTIWILSGILIWAKKIFHKRDIMQLFSVDATIYFCLWKVEKKHSQK